MYKMNIKDTIARVKYIVVAMATAMVMSMSTASATGWDSLKDMINTSMDILDIIVARQDSLIGIVILGAILGFIGLIIYGFVGKILVKVSNLGGGMK